MPTTAFPICKKILQAQHKWDSAIEEISKLKPRQFISSIKSLQQNSTLPPYLAELAQLEKTLFDVHRNNSALAAAEVISINPTLEVVQLSWQGLLNVLRHQNSVKVKPGEEFILVYKKPLTRKVTFAIATNSDLLALKIISNDLNLLDIAAANRISVGTLDKAIELATFKGLILSPPSRIRRSKNYHSNDSALSKYLASDIFTLQWHVTQACDLHCKHCYDRSKRESIDFGKALEVLDQMRDFCSQHFVSGQISFTGGNPLLYPRFMELYQEASDRNLIVAILGNPTTRKKLEELIAIQTPSFYQISLEGLEEHNDFIRGKGHFERATIFLGLLKELGIYSMVMLTLTDENREQVLPLAEYLRDRCDLFTFNRLSSVGEGAQLKRACRDSYVDFLEKYLKAAANNPVMALKDNLFNIILQKNRAEFFGGCAGFGCGAAFNFVSLLPDGEVHACRKFPSAIGTINEQSLSDIYHSVRAKRFRERPQNCRNCSIRAICGGCLAVTHSAALDIFEERDPYCFLEKNC